MPAVRKKHGFISFLYKSVECFYSIISKNTLNFVCLVL